MIAGIRKQHCEHRQICPDIASGIACRGPCAEDKRTTANAYYIAAQWHDKQAADCDVMAKDEPRLGPEIRQRAAANAVHHRASAAGLRLSATGLLRAAL
ncbi:hypothetical protein HFN98_24580 [Rhizobium laguerreae]|uniref:hypothetical protein n=1 Tax=Rhizobium laguerreae TaxID=1076926 RepID=UPI001C91E554|nr:hypothetical protein [Rhizobium laguerreae]MBY3333770.1 hypothetical protein [Rhizobium laguerreae]